MDQSTKIIVGLLVSSILVGILFTLYVKIFGKPTNNTDKCPAGTTHYDGYGCLSCDPQDLSCQTCTNDGTKPCKNGGKCITLGTGSEAGICLCSPPYFGNSCEKECSADVPCASGTCLPNGTCTTSPQSCTATNCTTNCDPKTCQCSDGWVSDPNDPTGKKCKVCAPGRGPPGDCSKVLYDLPTYVLADNHCIDTNIHTSSALDNFCQQTYGPLANWSGQQCHGSDGCAGNTNPILCNVPKFYAYSNFDPTSIGGNCPSHDVDQIYNEWIAGGGTKYQTFGRKMVTKATAAAMRKN